MKRLFVLVFMLLAGVGPVRAQTPVPPANQPKVIMNQPFGVLFDYPVIGSATGFRLYVDGTQIGQDIPVSAIQNGTVLIPGVVLSTHGAHQIVASAFNADWESKSTPLTVAAMLPIPAAPTNLRINLIVTIGPDGNVTVSVAGAGIIPSGGGGQ